MYISFLCQCFLDKFKVVKPKTKLIIKKNKERELIKIN